MKPLPNPLAKISMPLSFEQCHWLSVFCQEIVIDMNHSAPAAEEESLPPGCRPLSAAGALFTYCHLLRLERRLRKQDKVNMKSLSFEIEELVTLFYCYLHHYKERRGLEQFHRVIRSIMGRVNKLLLDRLSTDMFHHLFPECRPKVSTKKN